MYKRERSINFAMVAKVLGWLLMIEAGFMLVPFVTSLIYEEQHSAIAFLVAIVATGLSGVLMTFCIHPNRTTMRIREGLLLTSLVWFTMSLFGSIPFLMTGVLKSFPDAFFEMISGFTTTGATVIRDVEVAPKGILIWRSLTQWLGGMGIILFTLAVVPMLNHSGGLQLFNAEVTGITHDKLRPRISQTASSLWMIYISLTAILFLLLLAGPMDLFDAICHTLSTTATGGFSTKNMSVMHWDSAYINTVITIFMYVCGINFALLYKFTRGDRESLYKNDIFRWYTAILLVMSIIVAADYIMQENGRDWPHLIVKGFFSVISASSSSGFAAIEYEKYGPIVAVVIFLVMIFGSCAGSTSGGAKIDRLVLMLKNVRIELYRVLHPNTVEIIRINGKPVTRDSFAKTVAFLSIYFLIMALCALIFSCNGVPAFDSAFTSLSMISNIGYGYGATGLAGSYADLSGFCKMVCAFEMLVGRLELFTVLVLFSKSFWKI